MLQEKVWIKCLVATLTMQWSSRNSTLAFCLSCSFWVVCIVTLICFFCFAASFYFSNTRILYLANTLRNMPRNQLETSSLCLKGRRPTSSPWWFIPTTNMRSSLIRRVSAVEICWKTSHLPLTLKRKLTTPMTRNLRTGMRGRRSQTQMLRNLMIGTKMHQLKYLILMLR